MEEAFKKPIVHRPIIPSRPNHKVCIDLVDRIYDLFVREGVPHAHIREIRLDPNLLDIWHTLPLDMRSLLHHVVNALTFIQSLRVHAWSTSYSKDEAPGVFHHDSLPTHSSRE